jgi:hypothetical protein
MKARVHAGGQLSQALRVHSLSSSPVSPPCASWDLLVGVVQITCLGVYKWNGDNNEPACLGAGQDLTSFGYFQRSTVKEMLLFVSRTIVKRTQPGQRQSVEHNGAAPRGRGLALLPGSAQGRGGHNANPSVGRLPHGATVAVS